jgi:ABC-type polar amino acid transport system ATPase subunit
MGPKVMLFDEPTSSLDPETIGEVLNVMIGLAKDGTTRVCVTHAMDFARRVGSKILLMAEGAIIETGTPDEFFGRTKSQQAGRLLKNVLHLIGPQ